MKPLAQCCLYTFVDAAYLRGRSAAILARQLCDGGSDVIQLRAKDAAPDELKRLASELLPILNAAGVAMVINDHPEVAAEVGAAYFHLGQEDFFDGGPARAARVKALTGARGAGLARLGFGLSTHAPEQAQRALSAEADYLAVGPVYATPTKPTAKPVSLEYVRWAAANIPRPWFAIGGITLQNLDAVLEAGAQRICVVSAILSAPDVQKACQEFRRRLRSAGFAS